MDYQQHLKQAAQFIQERDHFLVLAHLHPDGDAIGSTLAMGHLLKSLGKTYTLANEGACPSRFSFLPGVNEIVDLSYARIDHPFASVIGVDVADQKRFGQIGEIFAEQVQMLNIDHHPTNTLFGTVNVIHPDAASTTQIIYDLVKQYFQEHMSQPLAEVLYTGLLTDTGGFRYSNTTQDVFNMASHLLSYGVRPDQIAEYALETTTASHLSLLRASLGKLEVVFDGQGALLAVTQEDLESSGATQDDAEGLVSYPKNIEGVEVGALLKEIESGTIKVSLRSKRHVNVAELAQRNGGGGHAKAAGYTFYGSINEAKHSLIEQLKGILGEKQ